MLSKKNVKACLAFAKKYKDWNIDQWRYVISSDEIKINHMSTDGKAQHWKRKSESLKRHYIKETLKQWRLHHDMEIYDPIHPMEQV